MQAKTIQWYRPKTTWKASHLQNVCGSIIHYKVITNYPLFVWWYVWLHRVTLEWQQSLWSCTVEQTFKWAFAMSHWACKLHHISSVAHCGEQFSTHYTTQCRRSLQGSITMRERPYFRGIVLHPGRLWTYTILESPAKSNIPRSCFLRQKSALPSIDKRWCRCT
jgi:hypothetical protein